MPANRRRPALHAARVVPVYYARLSTRRDFLFVPELEVECEGSLESPLHHILIMIPCPHELVSNHGGSVLL